MILYFYFINVTQTYFLCFIFVCLLQAKKRSKPKKAKPPLEYEIFISNSKKFKLDTIVKKAEVYLKSLEVRLCILKVAMIKLFSTIIQILIHKILDIYLTLDICLYFIIIILCYYFRRYLFIAKAKNKKIIFYFFLKCFIDLIN